MQSDYINQSILDFQELMTNNQRNIMKVFNRINQGELFVLHYLATNSTPALPTELSEALKSSTGRISALLGTLEKKGLIEREIDKSNRRNILVTITDAGKDMVMNEMAALKTRLTGVFGEMGEQDTLDFVRLAKKFFTTAEKYLAEME